MTSSDFEEKSIDRLFRISVFLKGLGATIEVIGGVLAYFIPVSVITTFLVNLAEGELQENPGDFVAIHALQFAHTLEITSSAFIAFYLLSRGIIKLVLVVALLKGKLWAYPSSLVVLALFVIYQFYQLYIQYSTFLVLLTLFDFVVMYLIWREYLIVKKRFQAGA